MRVHVKSVDAASGSTIGTARGVIAGRCRQAVTFAGEPRMMADIADALAAGERVTVEIEAWQLHIA